MKRRRSSAFFGRVPAAAAPRRVRSRFFRAPRGIRAPGAFGRQTGLGELKFFDVVRASTNSSPTGVIVDDSLNEIVQGITESQRIGRKCTLRSISVHGAYQWPTSATLAQWDNRMRVILYQDKQTNGATAAVTDILSTATLDSFRNLSNTGRFRVLLDQFWDPTVAGGAQSAAGTPNSIPQNKSWSFHKKLNIPLEFSGVTGAITELRSNNLGLLIICAAAADVPAVSYVSRVRFSDK